MAASRPAKVDLRCGGNALRRGKQVRCGKLLGYLRPSIDGPAGDPWIVLTWRGSPVCDHDTDPLAALDRRAVDSILSRAATMRRPAPYVVPVAGKRTKVYPASPPNVLDTPTGRVRVGLAPHNGDRGRFEFTCSPSPANVGGPTIDLDDVDWASEWLVIDLDGDGTITRIRQVPA